MNQTVSLEQGSLRSGPRRARWPSRRFLCDAPLVKRRHPRAAARVLPAIAACTDRLRLQMWMLEANEASSAELDRIFARSVVPRSSRRRKAPPARRTRKPSAR